MSVLLFPCFFWDVWFSFVSSWFELFSFSSRKLWLFLDGYLKKILSCFEKDLIFWSLELDIGKFEIKIWKFGDLWFWRLKIWNLKHWDFETLNLRFWKFWNLKFWDLRFGLWNLKIWKFETWYFGNLWFEILNMKFEVWNFCNLKF